MMLPTLRLIPILLLLVTTRYAVAQPPFPTLKHDDSDYDSDYGEPYRKNFNAATAILIVVLVSAFFFLAFLSLYFRRCSLDRSAVAPATAGAVTVSRRGARSRGLDPAILETFPTLAYSAVTRLKVGKESLECAVCLSEFSDDETLRMLPRCCHVFHPECIDTWLQTHVTCPVCRDDLTLVPTEGSDEIIKPSGVEEEEEEEVERAAVGVELGRMGRSHSTGHVSGGGDRFTLRVPEHVMREIVGEGRLRRSASVAVVGGRNRGGGGGGGGEGNWRRGLRVGLSGRWTSMILGRVSSTWRRREEGEGSGSVKMMSEGSVKAGIFDCLGGGGGGGSSGSNKEELHGQSSNNNSKDSSSIEVLDRV